MGWRIIAASPIFPAMSWFPTPVSPRVAFNDLRAFLAHRSREQVIGASLALLVTAIIVIEFLVDAQVGTVKPDQVTYVNLYPSNRTDAEIIADQKKEQAARAAAAKERQRQFQKLENKFGM